MLTRVKENANYNSQFPELFNWGLLDSISLSKIGTSIALRISDDLKTSERYYVGGLRLALHEISLIANIHTYQD